MLQDYVNLVEVEVLCMESPLGNDGLSSREGYLPHFAALWAENSTISLPFSLHTVVRMRNAPHHRFMYLNTWSVADIAVWGGLAV